MAVMGITTKPTAPIVPAGGPIVPQGRLTIARQFHWRVSNENRTSIPEGCLNRVHSIRIRGPTSGRCCQRWGFPPAITRVFHSAAMFTLD